ncbi:MAG: hypothetical protein H6634_08860 [Anaerolineales bacterium]|nr:hypothetical protein [candidate division KSB1 bacterium]MCB9111348.1 hypothetical protein [Anaerolineales bacterium]
MKNKITSQKLIRWGGLAAMLAGFIYAGIQPIHPPDFLPSVTTPAWAIIMPFKMIMCLLFMLGITGIYARQTEETGGLGLAGYLMLGLSWALQTAFIFTEAFILPVLATPNPDYVESLLGIVNGFPGTMNIGALPAIYGVVGVTYILGNLLFGIAVFHAHVLPRWTGGLLAIAALLTPAAALLPHALQRYAAIPVGIAMIAMGISLFFGDQEINTH